MAINCNPPLVHPEGTFIFHLKNKLLYMKLLLFLQEPLLLGANMKMSGKVRKLSSILDSN